eukprot:CAMPEP_0197633212 /NCGR_PEP_ID=MMETSP1338-20131121/9620_1 /TAXON_ID=43686 ORGANISM="Pelagodinium beii, Strain RCC1491" /NCGR_SAMPLE_ID=MMETSP1338 /ASSEMBLY_ACC=CAM_ASM_000754 /LENGTH=349 /DNA_ID=CAMNT_0043204823 /DNA_START=196 /DNA_END=1245 /DNA_ORIENTATION=-
MAPTQPPSRPTSAPFRRRHGHPEGPKEALSAASRLALRGLSRIPTSPFVESSGTPFFIFDWDDTLFPTSYVNDTVQPELQNLVEGELPAIFEKPLRLHAEALEATLRAARKLGKIAIVTLAARPWVHTSANRFLPGLDLEGLFNELDIQVSYAREGVSKQAVWSAQTEPGVNVYQLMKQKAMKRALKRNYGSGDTHMHVVNIGDSMIEHKAITEVLWRQDGRSICKTVKLLSEPAIEILTLELQILALCYNRLVSTSSEMDLDVSISDFNIRDVISDSAEDVQEIAKLCEYSLRLQLLIQRDYPEFSAPRKSSSCPASMQTESKDWVQFFRDAGLKNSKFIFDDRLLGM